MDTMQELEQGEFFEESCNTLDKKLGEINEHMTKHGYALYVARENGIWKATIYGNAKHKDLQNRSLYTLLTKIMKVRL